MAVDQETKKPRKAKKKKEPKRLRAVIVTIDSHPEAYFGVMQRYAAIYNMHTDLCFRDRIRTQAQTQAAFYHPLRNAFPGTHSDVVQAAMEQSRENIKGLKEAHDRIYKRQVQRIKRVNRKKKNKKDRIPIPKKRLYWNVIPIPRKDDRSGIRYGQKTMRLRGDKLQIWTLDGYKESVIEIPENFMPIANAGTYKGGNLCYQQGRFWAKLVFELDLVKPVKGEALGIDRGIYNVAALSNGEIISGRALRAYNRRHLYNRRTLQKAGTKSAKRRLKKIAGREARYCTDVNHQISKYIANLPYSLFIFEDLTGIRETAKGRGKEGRKAMSSWPHYQLGEFTKYKIEDLGKFYAKIDPAYTSQRCSRCGNIDKNARKKSMYRCKVCGLVMHADLNAAINIREKYFRSLVENGMRAFAKIARHILHLRQLAVNGMHAFAMIAKYIKDNELDAA